VEAVYLVEGYFELAVDAEKLENEDEVHPHF
jgi:hypothetical protein